jgi:hypothetical protein
MKTICCFITILFLWEPSIRFQNDDFLDLTKARVSLSEKTSGSGRGRGVGPGGPLTPEAPKVPPLKVTLLGLDKRSYQIGDEAIFEIKIENVTKNPIVVPWSADHGKVNPDENRTPPNYLVSGVSLTFRDGVDGELIFGGEGIYGSGLVPGSLKTLKPGQSVRIRAATRLSLMIPENGARLARKLPLKIELRAKYSFLEGSYYEPILSENEIIIELRKRSG